MRSGNLSHEMAGTRRMFARIGRDVDAELAAQEAGGARTISKCPRLFADAEGDGADVEWFFDQTQPGVLTALLTDLLDMRKAVRRAQANAPYGAGEWLRCEGQQIACKLIANSTYGATGVEEGRVAFLVVGATVTGNGKQTILNVHAKLLERYPNASRVTFCAGGDTDSVFFSLGHLATTADVGRWIIEVETYCNTLVIAPMEIQFEKEFEDGYLALAKKRYAFNNVGFVAKQTYTSPFDAEDEEMCERVNAHAVANGRAPPFDIALERTKRWTRLRMDARSSLKFKGMETVRRDSCEYVRSTLKRLLELVIEERAPERALAYARKRAQALLQGRVATHELVMSKHYSKLDYKTRALPHLTILEKCRERGDPVPELGERIAFLITRGTADKAYQRAETVERVLQDDLPIDYAYYLENQLRKPVLRILDWVAGFRAVAAPRKRHATKLALTPLLMAPSTAASTTARYIHIVEARAHDAPLLRTLCAQHGARVETIAQRADKWYVHTSAREAARAAVPEWLGAAFAKVSARRVARESGFEYVSLAAELVFGGLSTPAGVRAPAAALGIMRFARVMQPCTAPGCLRQTHALLCDACASDAPRIDAARAALDARVAAAAVAYEETLPVCRRCSGNHDAAVEIECANADCEHFYPRRAAQHARRRCAETRVALDTSLTSARLKFRALNEF